MEKQHRVALAHIMLSAVFAASIIIPNNNNNNKRKLIDLWLRRMKRCKNHLRYSKSLQQQQVVKKQQQQEQQKQGAGQQQQQLSQAAVIQFALQL